jgi:hypothetical protein
VWHGTFNGPSDSEHKNVLPVQQQRAFLRFVFWMDPQFPSKNYNFYGHEKKNYLKIVFDHK